MNKKEAQEILEKISKECNSLKTCKNCIFYLNDSENNVDGCVFDEIDCSQYGRYNL